MTVVMLSIAYKVFDAVNVKYSWNG